MMIVRLSGHPLVQDSLSLEVTCEDLPLLLGEVCVILAQGEYGEDCVSGTVFS